MRREFTTLSRVVSHTFEGELDNSSMENKILLFSSSFAVMLTATGDEDGCSISFEFPHRHYRLVTDFGFVKGELIGHDLLDDDDLEQLHKAEQQKVARAAEARREQFERLKKEFGDAEPIRD